MYNKALADICRPATTNNNTPKCDVVNMSVDDEHSYDFEDVAEMCTLPQTYWKCIHCNLNQNGQEYKIREEYCTNNCKIYYRAAKSYINFIAQ